jgi:hypothetical protein
MRFLEGHFFVQRVSTVTTSSPPPHPPPDVCFITHRTTGIMKRKICKICRAKRNQNQFYGDSKICNKCLFWCSKCGSNLDKNKKCACPNPLECFQIELKKLDIAYCLQIAGTDIFKAFQNRRVTFFVATTKYLNPNSVLIS